LNNGLDDACCLAEMASASTVNGSVSHFRMGCLAHLLQDAGTNLLPDPLWQPASTALTVQNRLAASEQKDVEAMPHARIHRAVLRTKPPVVGNVGPGDVRAEQRSVDNETRPL